MAYFISYLLCFSNLYLTRNLCCYLDKLPEKNKSLFKKNLSSFNKGFIESKYQRGY